MRQENQLELSEQRRSDPNCHNIHQRADGNDFYETQNILAEPIPDHAPDTLIHFVAIHPESLPSQSYIGQSDKKR